ncbi:hypothetical protein CHUAL_003702 [Chamberlinius hualienensis]
MDSVDVEHCRNTAVKLARTAGEVIKNAWSKKKSIQTKLSQVDLVTETDVEVEKLLRSGFKEIYPDHRFIGEESSSAGEETQFSDEPTWIIDPVDGTMNFVHSFPYVAISIALTVNKEVVVGVVYNPILDQMYTAVKEKGAFLNDTSIHVTSKQELSDALLALEVGSGRDEKKMESVFTNLKTFIPICHGIRSMGSAALNMCHVASGGVDAYFESGIHCWDMAAGDIIIREAGGVVLHPSGGPFDLMARGVLCASSQKLAVSVSEKVNYINYERD